MRSAKETNRVNHELKRLGFGSLDDPNLIVQIAFLIRDHNHFRSQLFSVAAEQRRLAYETLRPHLRFIAKPLDVYEAEMKTMAEHRQLPTWDDSAYPKAFTPNRITALAEDAIKENLFGKMGHLQLTCAHCQKDGIFKGRVRKEAEKEAQSAGWRSDGRKSYCPKHVPARLTMNLRCTMEDCEKVEQIRAWDEQDGYAKARLAGWVIGDSASCPQCSAPKFVS